MTAADPHEIRRALEILAPAGVFEIRAPKAKLNGGRPGTAAGYFDDHAAATAAAAKLSGTAPGVYITLNPVGPALLARAANRVDPHAERTTGDAEITERRWLLLDFDPERAAGISSSDSEHAAALERATTMRAWLHERGWPAPVYADSGNGAHLLYRVDLPNDNETKKLIEAALKTLASRFDDDRVKIDTGVFNASRISKIYGTTACKGDPLPDRPHRMARILESPITLFPVDLRLLHALVPAPAARPAAPGPSAPTPADFFGRVNARAMAALSAWVPALLPAAVPYHDGFRVKSAALGRPLEEDLSITPAGIVDFGVHDQGDPSAGKRTPIDLVLEHGRQADATEAAMWLCRTMGDDPAALGWNAPRGRKPSAEPRPAESGAANVEPAALELDPYRGTDEANAALFLALHGADVRYCPPWDKWLLWTGSHWRIDDLMDVARLAGDMPRELYRKAGESIDTARRRTIAGLARALESRRRQSDLLAAARCRVVVNHTDLDKGRFLLNARNGTIDLSTGGVREHRRVDLLTHDTEISYRPDTAAPLWERFLSEVFAGDADLIRFVQRAVGYSLTGDVREQVLLICHGNGSNGKSVFLNIVRKLLGKLALQAAPDLLMADRHRRHPTEQADLFGKRLVVCQETAEGRRFNEVMVKQLTGGDAITARRMFEDNWTFEPTHKLWLATNHRPEIRGTDHAIWRRIRLIPFNVQFSDDGDHRKDPDMEAKLTAELPGIMAWGVRGCLDWQREGLRAPEAVKAATEGYQQEQDVLAAWLADCCIVKRAADAKAADLYASYADWCEQSGEHPEPQRRWGMRLTERGFQRQRRMVGIFWLGIGLLKAPHEPYERNEPEKAKVLAPKNLAGKSAKSGSYGSLGTCPPPVDADEDGNQWGTF